MINKLQELVVQMAGELPGVLAAAVVTVDDGLSIAETGGEGGLETAAASAYLASIVKSNDKAMTLLAEDEVVDDILITTTAHHFIIRHLPNQPFFVFVMTSKDEWLGKARMLMRRYEPEFAKFEEYLRNQI